MDWYLDILKNHYADFEGRVGRKLFWMFVLVNIGLYIVIAIVFGLVSSTLSTIVESVFWLALLLPNIGMGIRRLHDIGKSGWLLLLGLIPLVGLVLIYFYAQPGDEGDNEYGPPPMDGDVSFA